MNGVYILKKKGWKKIKLLLLMGNTRKWQETRMSVSVSKGCWQCGHAHVLGVLVLGGAFPLQGQPVPSQTGSRLSLKELPTSSEKLR